MEAAVSMKPGADPQPQEPSGKAGFIRRHFAREAFSSVTIEWKGAYYGGTDWGNGSCACVKARRGGDPSGGRGLWQTGAGDWSSTISRAA
ncbi:MAG: hypothetical protein ACLR0U_12850 [Enterocloster clostridioformis]